MPAKRKYTDPQRDAIFRLFEAGTPSSKIAAACKEGRTGLASFEIPPRTVREITAQMTAEADLRMPATVGDLEQADAMERFPARAARILAGEVERLEAKQRKAPLSDRELDRLARMTEQSVRVEKALRQGKRPRGNENGPARRSTGRREPAAESVIDRLAREQREAESGARASLGPTHTRQAEPKCDNKTPDAVQADPNPGQPAAADADASAQGRTPKLSAADGERVLAAVRRVITESGDLTPEAAAELGTRTEAALPRPTDSEIAQLHRVRLAATQATASGG